MNPENLIPPDLAPDALKALPQVAVTLGAVLAMILLGAWMRTRRWIGDAADATMLTLSVRAFIPALIVTRVVGNNALRDPANVLWPPVVAFTLVTVGIFVAWGVGHLARGRIGPPRSVRTFAVCTGLFNYGYVTIPLLGVLFAYDGGDTLGVLFVFNLGVEAAMWGVGVTVLAGSLAKGWWRRLFGPPVVATLLALGVNLADTTLGLHDTLPHAALRVGDAVYLVLSWLGDAAIPVGLLLTGSTVADDWRRARLSDGLGTAGLAAALRLAALPVVFLLVAVSLPLTQELKRVLVFQAAMPAAVFPIVLARHFGGDVATALRVVVGTTLCSIVTTPLWIMLGLWLIR